MSLSPLRSELMFSALGIFLAICMLLVSLDQIDRRSPPNLQLSFQEAPFEYELEFEDQCILRFVIRPFEDKVFFADFETSSSGDVKGQGRLAFNMLGQLVRAEQNISSENFRFWMSLEGASPGYFRVRYNGGKLFHSISGKVRGPILLSAGEAPPYQLSYSQYSYERDQIDPLLMELSTSFKIRQAAQAAERASCEPSTELQLRLQTWLADFSKRHEGKSK